ncbi:S-layer homology domain-containing protein [Paenibacillus lignilyticus]|uniref:S-layer homology domain-containing protein n=1 Tax=Paenibacillus lignilyticus TaxID=1172615 RepID=A0ABS5C888_9BACL|nr:S-layer homology domain-containing protein [Paenibacillus lignilyticus]MBP3962040.1 S-layer homology domain-containing protein [Paenibacillus lignilyticus]
MKKAILKKAAITSVALLTLAGGAGSAFANGNDKGHDDKGNHQSSNGNKKNDKHGINLQFKDEKELKWALEYIIRLASKGVFNGYDDGTFKPQQKITRIESIVAAVRLMGLKEQAESQAEMSTKLNFKDADLLAKKYPWAVGYVAVALEKDLFSETDDSIQPDKPATRLFAATLLVKALGLEAEAKAKVNSELNFRDENKIPAGSVGYVQVAIEKGLITGYEDNTFRPNQPVTRAELAALLDRTDDQLPDQDAQAITGKLKADPASNAIVVVKPNNTEVALALDPNVFIFRNNVKVAVSALKAGDEVLVRTYQNKVVFIEVTKLASEQPAVTTQVGLFNSYSLNAQGKIATISITRTENGTTQAYVFNTSPDVAIVGNAALLVAGHAVELTVLNNLVYSIKVL